MLYLSSFLLSFLPPSTISIVASPDRLRSSGPPAQCGKRIFCTKPRATRWIWTRKKTLFTDCNSTTVVHDEDEGTGGGHKIVQYCFDQPCGPLNMQLHSTMLVVFLINTKNVFVIFFISASFHNNNSWAILFFCPSHPGPRPTVGTYTWFASTSLAQSGFPYHRSVDRVWHCCHPNWTLIKDTRCHWYLKKIQFVIF